MESITPSLIAVGSVDILMFPLLLWIAKRYLGKYLDRIEKTREDERAEKESEIRESRMWREAMTAGMRSLLRAEIIGEHRRWTKVGYCTLETKEYLTRCHTAYRGVGGNDIGDALYEEFMKLPTKKEE